MKMASRRLSLLFRISNPKVYYSGFFTQLAPASYSTHIVGDTPILVRDFIHSALYDPNHGYFSKQSSSVGVLDQSIKFHNLQGDRGMYYLISQLIGSTVSALQSNESIASSLEPLSSRKAYMKHLDNIYKQNDVSWFTPVELFKPWYAHGIAEAIMRTANLSVPLKIYEIGGGSGTCAKGVMDYMKLNAPSRVYNNMTYTSVEISSVLAKKQLETVGEVGSHVSKFKVECRDATDKSGWGTEEQPCWVIMLEVLDNLPHDLIYSEKQGSPWMEVWVQKQHDRSELSELFKPVQDPLITKCMRIMDLDKDNNIQGNSATLAAKNIWAKLFPKSQRCWLPTGCLQLLEVLHGALPKMSLVASDFSYLPDVRILGDRAPLVSTKKDGSSKDHNSYLDAKGDADIFFPTDFCLLECIDHYCSGWSKPTLNKSTSQGKKRRTIMLDTSLFMEEFGLPTKTRTKDGYNPLLDDFKNTKFYLSVPTHNTS